MLNFICMYSPNKLQNCFTALHSTMNFLTISSSIFLYYLVHLVLRSGYKCTKTKCKSLPLWNLSITIHFPYISPPTLIHTQAHIHYSVKALWRLSVQLTHHVMQLYLMNLYWGIRGLKLKIFYWQNKPRNKA